MMTVSVIARYKNGQIQVVHQTSFNKALSNKNLFNCRRICAIADDIMHDTTVSKRCIAGNSKSTSLNDDDAVILNIRLQ